MTIPSPGALQARRFLKDQAYDQIKQDILSGRLRSDTFWSERSLAERLQLGKAPVRDAINRLRQENYLTVVPQQGILVKPRTAKEIADTFEARLIIEPQVASRLAGKLSTSHQQSLEATLKHQQECVARGDGMEFIKWDVEFHMGLLRAHGNEDLISMMDRICERTFAAITHAFHGSVSRLAPALKAHKSILAAIVGGDSDLALQRMSSHIAETWKGKFPSP
jgi:DNA-binding GntR family transcriptional regulator